MVSGDTGEDDQGLRIIRLEPIPKPEVTMAVAIFCLQQGASTGDRAGSPVPVEGTLLGRKSALSLRDVVKLRVRCVPSAIRALLVRFKLMSLALLSFCSTPYHTSGFGIGSNRLPFQ